VTDLSRVPVVIGAGQFTNRDEDPSSAPDPFELMAEASKRAAADAGPKDGSGDWLTTLTHCWTVHSISLRHADPAGELARRIGAPANAEVRCSGMGGNIPQWLVNRAADLVRDGSQPIVLVVGAEALATRKRAKRAGIRLEWPSSDGWPEMWPPLEPDMGVHPFEDAHGLRQATTMYALVESAIAHAAGENRTVHNRSIGELMAGLNSVAASNPYSWFPERRSADELMTVTPDNRFISTPYPKYLNAVMDVDMSAAVIVTDAETARSAGMAPDALGYLRGWADANDVWYLSERPNVSRSPALERCVETALGAADLGPDDLSGFDLYACFPSSVEVARDSLGIARDDKRPLTLTGGLPYHGGPGSNYVTHAVCNALDYVRSGKGPVAVHGNGYYLTKHAVGVYSSELPERAPDPVAIPKDPPSPSVRVDSGAAGTCRVVAWTVPYGRDGSHEPAILIADTVDGLRTLARADDALTEMFVDSERDMVGETITIRGGTGNNIASPK
jgi:acetyl-CoA C-acetyltransferase